MTEEDSDQNGQLSEVSRLEPRDAKTPISDGDSIAGSPSTESGSVNKGDELGPDARTGDEEEEDRPTPP